MISVGLKIKMDQLGAQGLKVIIYSIAVIEG